MCNILDHVPNVFYIKYKLFIEKYQELLSMNLTCCQLHRMKYHTGSCHWCQPLKDSFSSLGNGTFCNELYWNEKLNLFSKVIQYNRIFHILKFYYIRIIYLDKKINTRKINLNTPYLTKTFTSHNILWAALLHVLLINLKKNSLSPWIEI